MQGRSLLAALADLGILGYFRCIHQLLIPCRCKLCGVLEGRGTRFAPGRSVGSWGTHADVVEEVSRTPDGIPGGAGHKSPDQGGRRWWLLIGRLSSLLFLLADVVEDIC